MRKVCNRRRPAVNVSGKQQRGEEGDKKPATRGVMDGDMRRRRTGKARRGTQAHQRENLGGGQGGRAQGAAADEFDASVAPPHVEHKPDKASFAGQLPGLKSGVVIFHEDFVANIDNFCAYVYFHEHKMSKAVMADFLLQRSRTPLLRTPHFLLFFALLCVRVDVERASCCLQQGIEKVVKNIILSVGEAAHEGRILDELYKMHLFLCWAFWLIFRLSP